MKLAALVLAGGAALAATVPAFAQTVTVTQDYPNALPRSYYYGPYAYDPGPYAYAPGARYVYDPNYPYGYWVDGRFYQCTQSYTPSRPDRSAGGANVTEQCF
jgi:hypothetical protein